LKAEGNENVEVIDICGLDDETVKILAECTMLHFNRVEVILHMIQVLVIQAQQEGIISIPPPILSRVYQTLSRGFVNLLNARKIKKTRFPFPYAQVIALMLLVLAVVTPFMMSVLLPHRFWCTVATLVPVFSALCMNYIAGELEMPFGDDCNDLPLTEFQEEMNSSLLMLIHDFSDHVPKIEPDRAHRDFASCKASLHDARNTMKRLESSIKPVPMMQTSSFVAAWDDIRNMRATTPSTFEAALEDIRIQRTPTSQTTTPRPDPESPKNGFSSNGLAMDGVLHKRIMPTPLCAATGGSEHRTTEAVLTYSMMCEDPSAMHHQALHQDTAATIVIEGLTPDAGRHVRSGLFERGRTGNGEQSRQQSLVQTGSAAAGAISPVSPADLHDMAQVNIGAVSPSASPADLHDMAQVNVRLPFRQHMLLSRIPEGQQRSPRGLVDV